MGRRYATLLSIEATNSKSLLPSRSFVSQTIYATEWPQMGGYGSESGRVYIEEMPYLQRVWRSCTYLGLLHNVAKMALSVTACIAITLTGVITTCILATLRFYTRFVLLRSLQWDDAWCLSAFVSNCPNLSGIVPNADSWILLTIVDGLYRSVCLLPRWASEPWSGTPRIRN